ncbi:hypothetical protein PMAYCL1PPCAC_26108, partial [Pristionchus mayeri]
QGRRRGEVSPRPFRTALRNRGASPPTGVECPRSARAGSPIENRLRIASPCIACSCTCREQSLRHRQRRAANRLRIALNLFVHRH